MGLQDRDYMRRRMQLPPDRDGDSDLDRSSSRGRFFAAFCVIAVAGLAIWLLGRVQTPVRSSPPRRSSPPKEGPLVVNINDATHPELESVPGIGPSLAARIIAGRPYESVDDLLRVSGIGEQTLEKLRPFLKTEGKTQPR